MTVLFTLLSHWRHRPFQAVTLIVGLALATALWSGVQAINVEAKASYDRAAAVLAEAELPTLRPATGDRIAQADYIALRRSGWPVSPLIDVEITVAQHRIRLLGLDPLTQPQQSNALPAINDFDLLRFITPPGLGFGTAETIRAIDTETALPPLVALADLPPFTVVTDIGVAQRLAGMEQTISRLLLPPGPVTSYPPLERLTGDRLRLSPAREGNDLSGLTDSFHLNLTAFGALSFVVGLFIVYAAIGLAFEQRRPMIRTLRACGVSSGHLTLWLLGELMILALIAGGIGVGLGYLLAASLLPDVAATLRGLYGAAVPGTLTLSPWWWGAGIAISMGGAGVAAGNSLWRTFTMPLLTPAQPEAWTAAQRTILKWQAVFALLLLTGALGVLFFGTGLIGAFAVLGLMLIGAALLLPVLLSLILRIGGRLARSPLAQWVWADSRQQLPGLSLALMALLLALAVNIGVGTMVGSFRQTFIGWLDQRLVAEVYLYAEGQEEDVPDILRWLEPRTDMILPVIHTDVALNGRPTEIYGFADHSTYSDNWPLLSQTATPWQDVARGDAILISEQLSYWLELSVGDSLILPTPGGDQSFPVSGVFADYGNTRGQVMISLPTFTALWSDIETARFGVRVAPQDAAALITDLRAEFDLTEAQVVDQNQLKAFSRSIFERTFAVTGALNVLTLGVATLALLSSLLTLATMRLPQLAPLWAMGLTRRQLALLELLKALVLAALTAVLAVPLGLAMAWVLTVLVNVEAFGWRLPILWFPTDWLRLGLLALVAAALAAAGPAWRLSRSAPGTLLKVFAHER